jgi:2,4-dienoyl-CoA reductase-like NADH-dependent reductase (Old Yellow Enzyme family)
MGYDSLFEPIAVGKRKIKNRLAFAPVGMCTADPEGRVTDQTLCHYVARAKGGVGLVIVEHTMSNYRYGLPGSGALSIHADTHLAGMLDLANAIRAFDTAAVVQLSLGLGRQAALHLEPVGPSAVPFEVRGGSAPRGLKFFEGLKGPVPRKLTVSEIDELENLYIAAVGRLQRCGFDGIEIHGAHGYMLANFLSPLTNRRKDRYGGSFEKRLTLALNLIRRSREVVGDDFILGFRLSGDEHVSGGLSLEDTLKVAVVLQEAGVDYIHLSTGTMESWKYTFPEEEGVILPEAEAVKKAVDIPVICPNLHDPAKAAQVVKEGRVDVVSLARSLLADPQWPNKVREGRIDEIQRCILCNGCLQTLFQGFSTRCTVNPNVGRERFIPECFPPPRKSRGRPI